MHWFDHDWQMFKKYCSNIKFIQIFMFLLAVYDGLHGHFYTLTILIHPPTILIIFQLLTPNPILLMKQPKA